MKCPGEPDTSNFCLISNYNDADKKYHYASTVTKDAITSYMNNITGIQDCTVNNPPLSEWWLPGGTTDEWWLSGGTMTSHNGMILVTFISSAMFVAMMTLLV